MKAMIRDRYGSADVLKPDHIAMPVAGENAAQDLVLAAGEGEDCTWPT